MNFFLSLLIALLYILSAIMAIASPILLVILIIRAIMKKRLKIFAIILSICAGSVIPLFVLAMLLNPYTWCHHDRELISETPATCSAQGKIVEYCSECDLEHISYINKLPHNYQVSEIVEGTCKERGYIIEKCTECSATKKTKTDALGHSMKEASRVEPTNTSEGKVVKRCERCGHEETEIIPRDESASKDTGFIEGNFDKVEGGALPDIESDNLVNELMERGFTTEEATQYREVFLMCGINSIAGAESSNPSATIDELVAYRIVMDDDRTLMFTIDKRELFYIALNGTDVYDTSKGGFLISIDDVHIPESEITRATAEKLRDKTTSVLEPYFINALYYDGWRYGRSDDNYAVQCEVYAKNRLGIKDWIFAKVYYEYDGTEFVVTAIVIDGERYK